MSSLNYPNKTMFQMVADASKKYPEDSAYSFMDKKTSYRKMIP